MSDRLTHYRMLETLERINFTKEERNRADEPRPANLADSLLLLAELDQEREYSLCRSIAGHLLNQTPEMDDPDLEEM